MYYKLFKFQLQYLKKIIFHNTKRFYRLHRETLRRKKKLTQDGSKAEFIRKQKNSSLRKIWMRFS